MTPVALESPPVPSAAPTQAPESAVAEPLPRDAILSLEQCAEILGECLGETRDLTSMGFLKYQLIDGERCVWLSDLLTYKRDFERDYATWEADPLNKMWDDPFFHETFGLEEIPQTR